MYSNPNDLDTVVYTRLASASKADHLEGKYLFLVWCRWKQQGRPSIETFWLKNMQERILLAIDPTNIPPTLYLSRVVKRFIIQKHQMTHSTTEIGILVLKEDETQWASPGFIKDTKTLMNIVDAILPIPGNLNEVGSRSDRNGSSNASIRERLGQMEMRWDCSTLFSILKDCLSRSIDGNIITRCILFFSRNFIIPKIDQNEIKNFYGTYPTCIIDVMYIHEKASEMNRVQEIYEALGAIENTVSRSYEVTKSQKRLLLATTELLGNPAFRSRGKDCHRWLLQ